MNMHAATALKPKAVRESRNFPRVQLPLETKIGDTFFRVLDCSSNGMGIIGIPAKLSLGENVSAQIYATTTEGKIRLDLEAQLVWSDEKLQRSGWRFMDVRPNQTKLIEELILLYASGKLQPVTSHGSAQNLVMTSTANISEIDKEATVATSSSIGLRRIIGLCFFALLGILAALYLGKMVYSKLFLIEASSASIFSPASSMTSPVDGTIEELQAEGSVKTKQVIAKIRQPSGIISEILSPCDCEVVSVNSRNGSFVAAGRVVSVLVASDAKPTISVRLPFQDLERVLRGAKVDLLYLDGQAVKGAKIINLPKVSEEASTIVTLIVEAGRDLKPSQVGEPVYAQINTAPW